MLRCCAPVAVRMSYALVHCCWAGCCAGIVTAVTARADESSATFKALKFCFQPEPADGKTDVCLRPPGSPTPYSTQQPGLSVPRALGHALWQLYLGAVPPAPEARTAWLKSVAEL